MNKKLIAITALSFLVVAATVTGCKKEKEATPAPESEIKGTPGNPRFNLHFDNETRADLDLHVITPSGAEIYFSNKTADEGTLDVDCLCGTCPTGPNENVYWTPGNAPTGTYKYWVKYYGDCDNDSSASNYTLRLMKNNDVLETYSGTLTPTNNLSPIHSISFQ